jgi:hypothetical protein
MQIQSEEFNANPNTQRRREGNIPSISGGGGFPGH